MKRPLTCVNLIKAIGTLSVGQDPVRLSRAIANVIVAQMLPDGVVKGGSSLLFRYGRYGSRYTRDIDTARVMEVESYLKQLNEALSTIHSQKWGNFENAVARKLTPKECFRLMGFENFIIDVPDRIAYRQAGNSIAVPVIKAILKSVFKAVPSLAEKARRKA